MDSLLDPEAFRDVDDVAFDEETLVLEAGAFESTRRDVDSHVAVGITDGDGRVLLWNDGSHGWTLPAFPVDAGDDLAETARRGVRDLLGVDVELSRPERVRRVEFRPEEDDGRRAEMYNVVFPATVVDDAQIPDEPVGDDPDASLRWFENAPDDQDDALADDVRLFLP